jgi:hypothetical protein
VDSSPTRLANAAASSSTQPTRRCWGMRGVSTWRWRMCRRRPATRRTSLTDSSCPKRLSSTSYARSWLSCAPICTGSQPKSPRHRRRPTR